MIRKILIKSIDFYQKHISPYKGYRCAYRAYTGGHSCSEFTKLAILEHGIITAIPLIKEQFRQCKFSAEKMQEKRNIKKKKDDSSACNSIDGSCSCLDLSNLFSRKSTASCDSCDSCGFDF